MDKIDLIALAGLLHDIGKFRQRCGFKNDLNDFEMGFAICDKQKCSYIHAAHTAKTIDEMGLGDIKNLIALASSHHKSNLDDDDKVIQLADRYASALDRKESLEELKQKDFIEVALQTPFSFVYLENEPKTHYYPLQKLEGSIKITDGKRTNIEDGYKTLYSDFIKEAKELKLTFNTPNDFLKLKSLLEKYTTFIPSSSYKTYPDVSLFDHLLATSAIAVAVKKGNGEDFSLIQGDFTSIQSFIFSKFGESNKYLAKILRAKSLFVNIATELIALKICDKLGLNPLSIVLNAGGKFTILAHKLSDEDKNKIEEVKEWVNSNFKEINFLQTKFVIKSIDFTKDKFKLGEFASVFKDLAYAFEKEKLRFQPQTDVFENYINEASKGICNICGIVPIEDEKEEDKICKYCQKFKEIGEKLPKAKYINFNLDNLLSISVDNSINDKFNFGFNTHPVKRVANIVPKFKESDINNPKYQNITQETEIKENTIKSFYHIANDGLKIEEDKLVGKNYLAILKADIDNLGEIFIRGFNHKERNEATFSRVLYLSRMIDYFFTTILMNYIKDKNVYTVFAGGDDLFLIGHYEDIVKTYEWIIKELKAYTKNQDFHLSAGIYLTRPNVPIPLMAELAEDEIDSAKAIDSGKNALTLFGVTLKNSDFLDMLELLNFFEELYENLQKVKSGISFMYRFYNLISMQKELYNNILQNARWKYMLRYLIEKNFEIKRSDSREVKEAKENIRDDLVKLGVMIEKYEDRLIIPLNLFLYSKRK